jgi:hypothetical protein
MLFPREHGAYGQMGFPLVTSLMVAELSRGAVLFAAVVIAGFLAHEPVTILSGARGMRARRERGRTAALQLWICGAIGLSGAVGALATMDSPIWWSLLVPAVPALCVAAATLRRREKSWFGEVAAALAFSAAAVPVAMAGGATVRHAVSIAIPFALLFVTSTLAVRVVVVGSRGGGDPRAVRLTRRAVVLVTACGAGALGASIAANYLPVVAAIAALPGWPRPWSSSRVPHARRVSAGWAGRSSPPLQ